MLRRSQFRTSQIFLTIVYMGAACTLFPMAFASLNKSRSMLGPALLTLAAASAGATIGALFRKAGYAALIGAAVAVLFMAAVVFFLGIC